MAMRNAANKAKWVLLGLAMLLVHDADALAAPPAKTDRKVTVTA